MRRVPDRSPPGRGRPRPEAPPGRPGPRGGRDRSTRSGPDCIRFRRRGPGRRAVAGPHLWDRAGSAWPTRENLCLAPTVHRLGRRRRLRRVRASSTSGTATRSPTCSATRRRPPCCAPGSSATGPSGGRGLPAGRPARDLRVRGLGPPHRPDRHGRRGQGPRHDPGARSPGNSPSSWARPVPGCRRPPTRATRRRHPLRPGGDAGAAGPGGPRPGRHPGHRRHLPERHPGARLRAPSLRGADAVQRDRQHPPRRERVPRGGGPDRRSGCRPWPTASTGPTRRSPTWPTAGSTAPPC